MDDISKIYRAHRIRQEKYDSSSFDKRKRKKKRKREYVKEHFKELTEMVHDIHKELEEKESPFRICVYQVDEEIFIDIITIDQSGKMDATFRHNITHDELKILANHIKSGRGLIFDVNV